MDGTNRRPIRAIAAEISQDWAKPYFGAVPYISAMHDIGDITETYIAENGRTVVMYFLANAQTWKGPVARRIKIELNQQLKETRNPTGVRYV